MKLPDYCASYLGLAADFWWLHDYGSDTIHVSDTVLGSLGYRPDDLQTPAAWYNVIHEADLAHVHASNASATRTYGVQQVRLRFRTKRGTWKTMLCRMRIELDDAGAPRALLGIGREIDDVVAIEAEILRRNEDLAQVASVLSHDFRGPARHISGCIERVLEQVTELHKILEGELVSDENTPSWQISALSRLSTLARWGSMTKGSAERMGKMIESVLQYSRAGTNGISPENIESSEIVTDIIRDYTEKIAERNVTVKVNLLPVVYYDPTMLYLLLANLISNAIKFSKKTDINPTVYVDGRSTVGEWVAIAVRDHGIGFPASQRERILEMGFRLHHESDYAGFGYGLAIVRRILHRCGGELGVRSTLGEGSEFVLKLPSGRLVRS